VRLPNLIDTHCHIDFTEFDDDRERVLNNAADFGVNTLLIPAVNAATWHNTVTVCESYTNHHNTNLLLALGLHPVFIDQHQPQHLSELDALIKKHKPVAVGEIGLDFYLKDLDREKQLNYFVKQLIIAKRHYLPVIIHNRKAHDECIHELTNQPVSGGIIHAFNGSIQQAQKYIELGFLLGFGGTLTNPRSRKIRNLALEIPLDAIVLETDAPDMPVYPRIGRNSPEYLPSILYELARLKQLEPNQVAETCRNNFDSVFPGHAKQNAKKAK
jgi:TatD DNase family protein